MNAEGGRMEKEFREIPLTLGKVALVDEADFEWLSQWRWFAHKSTSGFYYPRRNVTISFKRKVSVEMHRVILGLSPGDRRIGDHINHNTLDNRRCNLRIATSRQNAENRLVQRNNKLGIKGVSIHKGKFRAQIKFKGKQYHLGAYVNPMEAAEAYRKAAQELHGEFANWENVTF